MRKGFIFLVTLVGLFGLGISLWVSSLEASHQGQWNVGQQRLPKVNIIDNTINIKPIRDFRYAPDGQPISTTYYDDQFSLSDVKTLWFGLSRFGGLGMAHSFVSFEFDDGRFLVLSVEARTEQGQHYNPVLGLFRQYEMIYVIGTEKDIIGLRSFVRKEPLYLYPLVLTKQQIQSMLVSFFQDVNALAEIPQFYNTLLHNCLSQLLLLSGQFSPLDLLGEWQVDDQT